ncbi:MAG: hypothetical protein WC788_04815 [Candidatus Paceibacterota bacterium]
MSKSNQMPNLQIMSKCPMCDFKYEKDNIRIIEKKEGLITLYMNCTQCKSSLMMVIMTGALGITSVSTMTDIVEDDIERISGNSIDYDDVLEMHRFLEECK